MPIMSKDTVKVSNITEGQPSKIDRNNTEQDLVNDPVSNELLKSIDYNMKKIKEQNDEIIGDEF